MIGIPAANKTLNPDVVAPPGIYVPYGGASAPKGWLLCDGSAVSRTTYADLFDVIGTDYGVGDGSTTFNLPDMRQRFPLGKAASGTGANIGDTGGTIDHDHDSPITTSQSDDNDTISEGGLSPSTLARGVHRHTASLTAQNPPFLTGNFIIKT